MRSRHLTFCKKEYTDDIKGDTVRHCFWRLMILWGSGCLSETIYETHDRQADVVVPVIAGPTIGEGGEWAEHLIRPEWSTKISSVIVTKRDAVHRLEQLLENLPTVASICEIPDHEGRILLCDTPEGMAAMQLRLLLDNIQRKHAAEPIHPGKIDKRLQEETAIVIAGITDPSSDFHRVSLCDNR